MRKPFKILAVLFTVLAITAISIELIVSTERKSVGFIVATVGYATFFLIMAFRSKPRSPR